MKTLITQTFLISCLSLSIAYARDHKGGPGGRPEISAENKAAFEACHEEVGMPDRDSGERPTKEQHEAFKTCLEKKGITLPQHGKGRGGPPPERNEESEEK
ncbi:hypothetical protein CIK05_04975 [Bdellovibrio sp. qaytius]|nr:hypothetical protein CIK05_04975 [Bdellovibrio sp. qaytius]